MTEQEARELREKRLLEALEQKHEVLAGRRSVVLERLEAWCKDQGAGESPFPLEMRDLAGFFGKTPCTLERDVSLMRQSRQPYWKDQLARVERFGEVRRAVRQRSYATGIVPLLGDFREYRYLRRLAYPTNGRPKPAEEMERLWAWWRELKVRAGEDLEWMDRVSVPGCLEPEAPEPVVARLLSLV